jgi:hypothetical protein
VAAWTRQIGSNWRFPRGGAEPLAWQEHFQARLPSANAGGILRHYCRGAGGRREATVDVPGREGPGILPIKETVFASHKELQ